MDHYPEVSVNERETPSSMLSSRHDSASSIAKAAAAGQRPSGATTTDDSAARNSSYTSFPSPSTHSHSSNHSAHRSDSSLSSNSNLQRIEAEYARYTDAPPPYSEKAYEGKSDDERNSMRMTDYAKEISRMMGRQLVRGLKIDEREKGRKGDNKAR
ncbi:uncharacterized protein J4E78_010084 [Alternaria triticimaculans]|uniref:uncharacterized protein n=1 Tax=Alternaria triticimaculans TaxID=297637 RepID=UPI0020C347EA|nr:uncharacterized protein J4E78_010084 [Alternaria triticimaculans]KAI4642753.1 hypothetical protein J4E78_010084 [Alternaria triticimaculans]